MSKNDKPFVKNVKTLGAKATASNSSTKKTPTRVTGKSPILKK
ncbi:MAG: hypothetical protein WCX22_08735 [Methanoregula sp.]